MTTLQDQLDEITANTRQLVQAERLAVGERAIAELFASDIEERILPVGAQAPEFALKDTAGRMVRSQDLLALGPLVIKSSRAVVFLLCYRVRGLARLIWADSRA